jgi:hypothetical protein
MRSTVVLENTKENTSTGTDLEDSNDNSVSFSEDVEDELFRISYVLNFLESKGLKLSSETLIKEWNNKYEAPRLVPSKNVKLGMKHAKIKELLMKEIQNHWQLQLDKKSAASAEGNVLTLNW